MQTEEKQLSKVLQTYLSATPIAFAYVFGSTVSGFADSESDIDIAVGFGENFSKIAEQDFAVDALVEPIALSLGVAVEKIDIKIFGQLPVALRFRIIRDGKLIYLKDIASHRLQAVRTMRDYDDEKSFFETANKIFFNHYSAKNI